jgi:arginase
MSVLHLIEAPSMLGLRPSGLERSPDALAEAGLADRLLPARRVRLEVPAYDATRDPATMLLNPGAIALFSRRLARAVGETLDDGATPVVIGGDCSILLGDLLALRRRGRYGLLFIDGHADFCDPSQEDKGEVASLDLALATGRGPAVVADIDGLRPLVRDEDVALLGYRVHDDVTDNVLGEHVTATAICVVDEAAVHERGAVAAAAAAAAQLARQELCGVWLHLDIDVLDDALMPAVDYREPGGLRPDQVVTLIEGVADAVTIVGMELTIYNPALDPDGACGRLIVDLLARIMSHIGRGVND